MEDVEAVVNKDNDEGDDEDPEHWWEAHAVDAGADDGDGEGLPANTALSLVGVDGEGVVEAEGDAGDGEVQPWNILVWPDELIEEGHM